MLKDLRERKGLPVYKAAVEIGVSPSTVSSWEGETTHPNLPQIKRLITVYDLTDEEVLALFKEAG